MSLLTGNETRMNKNGNAQNVLICPQGIVQAECDVSIVEEENRDTASLVSVFKGKEILMNQLRITGQDEYFRVSIASLMDMLPLMIG